VIIYPEEAERVVDKVQTGKWHALPPEMELIGQEIASLSDWWSRNVRVSMLSYEEARRLDPRVDSWMLLAESAALSAHGFICEDGRELPREEGQEAAQEGRKVFFLGGGMYAPGCKSLDQARIPANPGMPRTGVRTVPAEVCTSGGGMGSQGVEERT
jgi:hypothetical protein